MSNIEERLNDLSAKEKRELLAQTLRESLAQRKPANSLPILVPAPRKRAVSLGPAELAGSPPYVRYVNPHLGSWLKRLDLDKQYVRGEGCYLFDMQGVRYLDFIAQYGVLAFGYNPPEIWDAIERVRKDQLPSFVQPSILTSAGELAKRLVRLAPPGLSYVTFANSGAEAVEAAIKLSRSATGRRGILAAHQGFHGKTLGALSATGSALFQQAFGAPVEGFHHVPFGNIQALSKALSDHNGFYAAFVVEPIQGEGGVVEAPAGYLTQARDLCRRAGTLLILDEIQTGLGRTGKLFACDHEGVIPDVMTLAKALGGGLMPIGACLYKEELYNEEFALRHSSTFAGNALACQAALATLDLLEKDDRAIVRRVAENGDKLKQELLKLRERYPELIKSVRGKGYLLGVEFDLDLRADRYGFLAYLAEQNFLTYLIASYLLNVEKIRVAPTASAEGVLRLEPALIAGWSHCQMCLDALDRTLRVLACGDTAQFFGHLVGANGVSSSIADNSFPPQDRRKIDCVPKVQVTDGRFAFLIHLNGPADLAMLDPNLKVFSEEQLIRLKKRGAGLLAPLRFSEIFIQSRTGQKAYGEFIAVPYTARELTEIPRDEAVSEIGHAVEIARQGGAQIVGLGGFTSVATFGGLILNEAGLGPLTTGNSYTVAAARRGVQMACKHRNRKLCRASVAIIGATGAVGRGTALLISQDVAELMLIGNPAHPQRSRVRLLTIAASILGHLWKLHVDQQHVFAPDTLGSCLVSMSSRLPPQPALSDFASLAEEMERRSKRLCMTTDLRENLLRADVVITATSSVEGILEPDYIKPEAIVCEMSRPFNVTPEVKASRPDVLFVEGGLVRAPSEPELGWDIGHGRGIVFACVAETMLLALEHRYQNTSLGTELDIQQICQLDTLGDKHGFSIECVFD
jgi:acetylornithine/succinyldiaminopimelate/putrescine aminotransferase/predicted amino acid dehydrogenase